MPQVDSRRPIVRVGATSRKSEPGSEPGIRRVVHYQSATGSIVSVTVAAHGPHVSCRRHNHRAGDEQFYVVAGTGFIEVDNETHEVTAGDSVMVPARRMHSVTAGLGGITVLCTLVRTRGFENDSEPWTSTRAHH